MVQSKAATVEAYLADAAPERSAELRQLRALARKVLRDHEERMQWGMPAYVRAGRIAFAFAAHKQYLSLYFFDSPALERNAPALSDVSRGKRCLRFRKSARIDWRLIEKLLVDTRDFAMEGA